MPEIMWQVLKDLNGALLVHPGLVANRIKKWRKVGILLTVSTGDLPFFHTGMKQKYKNLTQIFGWMEKDFLALNFTAVKTIFFNIETKHTVLKALESA